MSTIAQRAENSKRRGDNAYEHLTRFIYPGVGQYDIPEILPTLYPIRLISTWLPFNYAPGIHDDEAARDKGIHFFISDDLIVRVWNRPDKYTEMLSRFPVVCTPDFSIYTDYPKAIQIYNHYRKHWLGAYWQAHGLTVIPTISWATPDSFDWCFDGEPRGGVVAVSSVGTCTDTQAREYFRLGYNEMLTRLQPAQVLFYGHIPKGLSDGPEIIHIPAFGDSYHARCIQKIGGGK